MKYLKCIAFHPLSEIWVDSPPKITEYTSKEESIAQLSEVVYSLEAPDLTLRISRDGFVYLHCPENEPPEPSDRAEPIDSTLDNWSAYLRYLNCFWLLWDAEVTSFQQLDAFDLYEITIRDVLRVTCNERGSIAFSSLPLQSRASEYMQRRWQFHTSQHSHSLIPSLRVICLESCRIAAEKLATARKHQHLVTALSSLAKSVSEYKNADYSTSSVLAWFIIESIVSDVWDEFLDRKSTDQSSTAPRISRSRRDKLTGRDFTMSIICEVLELCGIIETDLLRDIDKARSLRNRVVHQQHRPNNEECRHSILTASILISFKWSFEVKPNLGYFAPGL